MTDVTAPPTESGEYDKKIDSIADLLLGDEEGADELDDDSTPADLSSEQADASEGDDDDSPVDDATVAQILGFADDQIELDEDGNFVGIVVNVNGEKSVVSTNDLVASYQTNKAITQKAQYVAEEKRRFEGVRGQAVTEYENKVLMVEGLANQLKNALIGDYSAIDWQRLRAERPGEYAALVQDMNLRQQNVDAILNNIQAEIGQFHQRVATLDDNQFQEFLRGQYQEVVNHNPAWRDPRVMERDMSNMGMNAAKEYGITPAEFAYLTDARHVAILQDALAYRSGKQAVKEKTQSAPKFQRSGRGPARNSSRLDKLTAAAKKAKGAQQRELQTAAVAELLVSGKSR